MEQLRKRVEGFLDLALKSVDRPTGKGQQTKMTEMRGLATIVALSLGKSLLIRRDRSKKLSLLSELRVRSPDPSTQVLLLNALDCKHR